jgi:outer membrane protein
MENEMNKTKSLMAFSTAIGFSVVSLPVLAYEAGDWLIRGRIIQVAPQDSSGNIYVNGGSGFNSIGQGVAVNSDVVPEIDITYMLHRNWGVGLILGYSEHTVRGNEGNGALGDVANTRVLPPTVTLQYHFRPDADIRPYVGAGINYTYFFDESVPTSSALSAPGDSVKLDSSWGLALQAGVDVAIDKDWFFNLDVKYLDIDTQAHYSGILDGNTRARVNADIDPLVWGIGIGRRF